MVYFLFQCFCLGLHSYGQKKLLEKISDSFCFLNSILIFSIFYVNQVTLRKILFLLLHHN